MTKARDIASAAPAPSTVSATEIGYLDGVTSAIQTQIDSKQAANANVSTTELGYLDGVTSAIQTQLDGKTAKSTLTTTGDIYYASSANTPARLGIGSTGNVLTVSGGIPAWAAPSSTPTFVGARAGRINSNQSISNNTNTIIGWDSETFQPNFDTDSIHSTSTNNSRFTVPTGKGGYWLCIASVHFESNGNGFRVGEFLLNTDLVTKGFREASLSATDSVHTASTVLKLAAGDYVEFRVYQNSGTSLAIQADSYNNQFVFAFLGA